MIKFEFEHQRQIRFEIRFDVDAQVWPGVSVYPDFTLSVNVTRWWTRHCRQFWNRSDDGWGVEFDALWIVSISSAWLISHTVAVQS